MGEFFAMGGYAGFVWPAYGLSALVLIGLTVMSLRGYRRSKMLADQLEAQRPSHRKTGAGTEPAPALKEKPHSPNG
jgi:heme exporter protein D